MCTDCRSVIDVAFVVDSSIKNQGAFAWNQMIAFVNLVIDRLTISLYAALVSFVRYGDRATVEFRFREYSDRPSTQQRILTISYRGDSGNNLADALDALRNQVFEASAGARSVAPWVAVVVTDRSPSIRAQEIASIASQARVAGIQIIPVGILGSGLNRNILNQIAFSPSRVTTVNSYNELSSVAIQVADWICNTHLSKYFQWLLILNEIVR